MTFCMISNINGQTNKDKVFSKMPFNMETFFYVNISNLMEIDFVKQVWDMAVFGEYTHILDNIDYIYFATESPSKYTNIDDSMNNTELDYIAVLKGQIDEDQIRVTFGNQMNMVENVKYNNIEGLTSNEATLLFIDNETILISNNDFVQTAVNAYVKGGNTISKKSNLYKSISNMKSSIAGFVFDIGYIGKFSLRAITGGLINADDTSFNITTLGVSKSDDNLIFDFYTVVDSSNIASDLAISMNNVIDVLKESIAYDSSLTEGLPQYLVDDIEIILGNTQFKSTGTKLSTEIKINESTFFALMPNMMDNLAGFMDGFLNEPSNQGEEQHDFDNTQNTNQDHDITAYFDNLSVEELKQYKVVISTDYGDIHLEFFPEVAPNHVKNFLNLASSGFYDGTTFHRVIPQFMIQGGDPNTKDDDPSNDGMGGPGYTIDAEFSDISHERGILSMARASDPDSAGSQFFIMQDDAPHLDGKYSVFGKVTKGLDVVDEIAYVKRDLRDRPLEDVEMQVRVYIMGEDESDISNDFTVNYDDTNDSDIKIAMATDIGGLDDESFNDSAWTGLQRVEKELGIDVEVLVSKSDKDYEKNLKRLADEGHDLIWAIGFLMSDAIRKVADDYPDNKFGIIDSNMNNNVPPNVVSVMFKEEEGSFLVGLIAGLMTETDKVGFIGGIKFPLIDKYMYGFKAGALLVNSNIELIDVWADSFVDASLGKTLGNSLYNDGYDIIFHAAGNVGKGLFQAAIDHDKWAIGVDSDQRNLAQDNILTSMTKRIDNVVYDIAVKLQKGEFHGGEILEYGLKGNGVGYAPTHPAVRESVLDEVERIKELVINGNIEVPYDKTSYDDFINEIDRVVRIYKIGEDKPNINTDNHNENQDNQNIDSNTSLVPMPRDIPGTIRNTRPIKFKKGKPGGVFVSYNLGGPSSWNDTQSNDYITSNMIYRLQPGLMDINYDSGQWNVFLGDHSKGDEGPGYDIVVDDYHNKMEIIIYLRKDIYWSDDTHMTADDWVYYWNEIMSNPDIGHNAYYSTFIEENGVELPIVAKKIDKYTFKYEYPRQIGDPELIISGGVMPKHIIKPVMDAEGEKGLKELWDIYTPVNELLAYGPWIPHQFNQDLNIVFVKNEKYFKKDEWNNQLPYLDKYVVDIISDYDRGVLKL